LAALLKEIDDGDGEKKTDTKKNDDGASDDGDAKFAELTKAIDDLTKTVAKQDETIRQLREQPAGSNALPVDKSDGDGKAEDDTVWPLDMNTEGKISKAAAEKRGVSFYDSE